jgi:RNA polymerase II subunit A small phosphatase-like protein
VLAAGGAAAAIGAASFAVRTPGGSSTPIPGTPVTPPSPTISQGGTQHPPADIAPEVLAASQRGGTHLPRDETADVLSGAVQAPGSEGLTPKKDKRRKSSGEASSMAMSPDGNAAGDESHVSSASSTGDEALEDSEDEYLDEDERIIAAGGMGIPIDENGIPRPLLAELTPSDGGRKCLVLDLDETLLHSSFKVRTVSKSTRVLANLVIVSSKYMHQTLSCLWKSKIRFIMYTS